MTQVDELAKVIVEEKNYASAVDEAIKWLEGLGAALGNYEMVQCANDAEYELYQLKRNTKTLAKAVVRRKK